MLKITFPKLLSVKYHYLSLSLSLSFSLSTSAYKPVYYLYLLRNGQILREFDPLGKAYNHIYPPQNKLPPCSGHSVAVT